MEKLSNILDKVCFYGAVLACTSCAALAVMLIVEVITTSFFSYSQPWAVEYSGYLLVATLFAGSGWTLGQGGHIRVSILLQFLNSDYLRLIDLVISVLALGLLVYIEVALIENTYRSYERGSLSFYPSRTPVWLPQLILALSWLLLLVGLITRILRLIVKLPTEYKDESFIE